MTSIKFDSTEILNTTYIPRYIKHESAPERELNLLNLIREDGSVIVSEKYGTKRVTLVGILTSTSELGLDLNIDSFKELFSRKEKNLEISWAGSSRMYVATCVKHEFDRDHFHLLFVPWSAEFIVVSGIGEDSSESQVLTNYEWNGVSDYSPTLTFSGSAKPKPRIVFTMRATLADTRGISIKNNTTGEEIVITRDGGWVDADVLEIDCRLKTVKLNGTSVPFYKQLLSFIIGANSLTMKTCDIIDQQSYEFGVAINNKVYGGTYTPAMSFTVPYTDVTYQKLSLYVMRLGTLAKNLLASIQTDDNGKPSGVVVTNANFSFPHADIGASYAWESVTSISCFTLNANTRYWIVLNVQDSSGDTSNCYQWCSIGGVDATYKKGNLATTTDGGTTWVDVPAQDATFRLMYGGYGGQNCYVNVYYYKRYL